MITLWSERVDWVFTHSNDSADSMNAFMVYGSQSWNKQNEGQGFYHQEGQSVDYIVRSTTRTTKSQTGITFKFDVLIPGPIVFVIRNVSCCAIFWCFGRPVRWNAKLTSVLALYCSEDASRRHFANLESDHCCLDCGPKRRYTHSVVNDF